MGTIRENTGKPLRVLIVEDSEDDVDLLVRELRRNGFEPGYQCVKTADGLIAMLDRQQWDIIICDYSMPGFSGTQALSIVRSRGFEAPFIFVSGTIGEDVAVSAMRAGAQDYVIKGNLKRLGPAIERELRESDARRERALAEAERHIAEDRFRQILMIAADAIIGIDEDMRIIVFNRGAEIMFGYRASEAMGQLVDLVMPSSTIAAQRLLIAELAASPEGVQTANQSEDFTGLRKNGEEFPTELTISKLIENGKATFTGIIRDISGRKRAEQRLRLLSQAVEQSANLIILTNADGVIEYVNSKFLEVMGYTAGEIIGHKTDIWVSGETQRSIRAELWNTVLAGKDWRGEIHNRRKDGGMRVMSATVAPIRDEHGRITHFLSVQEDVTRLREIEAQRLEMIEQEHSRLRSLLDAVPAPIIVARKDGGQILYINKPAYAMTGIKNLQENPGARTIDLFADLSVREKLLQDLNTTGRITNLEFQLKRGDGSSCWVLFSGNQMNYEGQPAIIGTFVDITARREAEDARRQSEQRLRLLSQAVEQSANLIILTDTNGTVEYVNSKFLEVMGYSTGEIIGHKAARWVSSKMDSIYAELWDTILAGKEWRGELRNRRKDGGVIVTFTTIAPVKDERERITHFISIQEDVTKLREIEEQQRRSQRLGAVGQLTGGIAHDFNNMLTVTIGNLDLLLEEPAAQNPIVQEFARTALDAALRGAGLTGQLLAFARGQILEPTAFDLNELVSSTTNLLRRTLGEHIKIETVLAGNLWLAHADPKQLETALTNLTINARDAMPGGGRLTIETANKHLDEIYAAGNVEATPGEYVMLAVSDTGAGIPPGILTRVFEPFFTTKEPGKGTGLGLSMVYGFVKQSQGHIKIYSEAGHGTTIRLYLPKAQDGVALASEEGSDESETPVSGAKILVADDNPDVRNVVVKQLTSLGYHVIDAQDGASALDIIRSDETIDLVFTDIVMPGGMTGIELAREVRKIRPQMKILLTSGFAEATVQNGIRPADTINILSKPYRRQELARKIQEVLSGKI